jgi:hypothetical protein
MGCIMLYLTEEDLKIIIDWLNEDEDIAYLVKWGDKKWIAQDKINGLLPQGKHLFMAQRWKASCS